MLQRVSVVHRADVRAPCGAHTDASKGEVSEATTCMAAEPRTAALHLRACTRSAWAPAHRTAHRRSPRKRQRPPRQRRRARRSARDDLVTARRRPQRLCRAVAIQRATNHRAAQRTCNGPQSESQRRRYEVICSMGGVAPSRSPSGARQCDQRAPRHTQPPRAPGCPEAPRRAAASRRLARGGSTSPWTDGAPARYRCIGR